MPQPKRQPLRRNLKTSEQGEKKFAAVPAKRVKQFAVAFTRTDRRGGRK
jgi:hypothetical protein